MNGIGNLLAGALAWILLIFFVLLMEKLNPGIFDPAIKFLQSIFGG